MNTNIKLTAEEIAEAGKDFEGPANRSYIENAFEAQTPREVFLTARHRADMWPRCGEEGRGPIGVQYAYLLEFLICDEMKKRGDT